MILTPEQVSELVVVHEQQPVASTQGLIKLATFMGVPVRSLRIGDNSTAEDGGLHAALRKGGCVAVSAHTLRRLQGIPGSPIGIRDLSDWFQGFLFVYGFEPGEADSNLASCLSRGALSRVSEPKADDREYTVTHAARAFCQEFSGLIFGPVNRRNDLVFRRAKPDPAVLDYIRIGEDALLVGVQHGGSHVVLTGTRQVLDVDAPAGSAEPFERFAELIPAMLFLRFVFGDRCWQGARKMAAFIVDDPMLRQRHGFLRYDDLLAAMERSHFSTNISFIPWNYRRSRAPVAEFFRRFPERLSLSVHGCDHTRGEFALGDEPALRAKAQIALQRMKMHQQRTGVPFDRVMVFPQGAFSSVALSALKASDYLAAVSSGAVAQDAAAGGLRWRDLLDVAVTRYGNFPLFVRHYPKRLADFALDLFLGRPVLMVEHHGYFRGGCGKLEAFAQQINRLSPGIHWGGLETAVRHAALRRRDADGRIRAKFYCYEPLLENSATIPLLLRFESKLFHAPALVPGLTTGGQRIEPWRGEEGYGGEVVLPPGQAFRMNAVRPETTLAERPDLLGGLAYRLRVFARRRLCDFRDNYVSLVRPP